MKKEALKIRRYILSLLVPDVAGLQSLIYNTRELTGLVDTLIGIPDIDGMQITRVYNEVVLLDYRIKDKIEKLYSLTDGNTVYVELKNKI